MDTRLYLFLFLKKTTLSFACCILTLIFYFAEDNEVIHVTLRVNQTMLKQLHDNSD